MRLVEVLLVEDNAGDIMMVRQALAREPFPVAIHLAVDGKQATQMLEAHHFEPDLVILDLNIPKVHGLSVLVKSEPNIPVVVFTSSESRADRQRAYDLGVKDYVRKPIDLDQYGAAVSRIVREWAAPRLRNAACQ
jgi:two-component system, chemotaxis family, response regulator Rcp1